MIQSDKSESIMEIKNYLNKSLDFVIRRLFELFGMLLIVLSLCLLISLVSYSPEDPNFIFPENTESKNLIGYRGSYISDLFFQSIGLVSYLVPLSLVFTGFFIFKKKNIFLIIQKNFYVVLYSLLGSLFLAYFYQNSFILNIHGNGGFIGNYLNQVFFNNLIFSYEDFFFFFLSISSIILFFAKTCFFAIQKMSKKLVLDVFVTLQI